MSQRIAFVTGGTGAIGTAICHKLYDQGILVIAGYAAEKGKEKMQADEAHRWRTEQEKNGYQINIIPGDVSDYEACESMIKAAEEIGPIDILVNVAGITDDATFMKMTHQKWLHVIKINLDGVFNVTHQVIEGMIKRKFGRIISISSVNARKGNFGQTNYSAAKAGIIGFTKSLALEVAKKGVTVNTVSPGYVDTPMMNTIPPQILEKIISQIPIERLGKPSEIAQAVSFLAQDESEYITGCDLPVNGGLYLY